MEAFKEFKSSIGFNSFFNVLQNHVPDESIVAFYPGNGFFNRSYPLDMYVLTEKTICKFSADKEHYAIQIIKNIKIREVKYTYSSINRFEGSIIELSVDGAEPFIFDARNDIPEAWIEVVNSYIQKIYEIAIQAP
ncbi:hypothetical protein [Gorillibacterium sp. sgz500922]|uniref:hypothetical protein n=1 Tax=Gorillibacterium sp. sgz500922 TaxID=3446694 RepID=UPI003F6676BF